MVPTNEDNVLVRVDHQLNDKTSIFGRYEFDTDSVNAQQSIPDSFLDQATCRQYTTLQETSIPSSHAVNNFRVAFNRTYSTWVPIIDPAVPASTEIIPGQPLGAINVGTVGTSSGSQALTGLGNFSGKRLLAFNIFEWGDDFSYVAGKNSFKFGGDIQRMRDNTALGNNFLRGEYTFPSLTAFLAGQPSSLTAAWPVGILPQWGLRQSLYAVYAQDDYSVNSRLTLNIGLRWETATDPKDANGHMSILPSLSAPAMVPSDRFFSVGKRNFEPRLGLAWQLDESGKTVVRASGGMYHNQILPYIYALNISNPPFLGRYLLSNPPFPDGYTLLTPNAPLSITPAVQPMKTPVDYQYNLSIQRQIFGNTVLQAIYAGNQSRHLEARREANPTTPIFTAGDFQNPFYPAGAPRMNPAFASMDLVEMNGNSAYNSGAISLRRRSSSGFVGQISYTFSKSMDANSGVSESDSVRSPQDVMDPFDIHRDWARSDFDVTHAVVADFSYPMPFRAGSKALGRVANGWTLDGVVTFQTGMPFTILSGANVSRDGAMYVADRPNLNPGANQDPTSATSAGCNGFPAGTPVENANNWYDPCAYSLALAGTYGNLGRNTVIGPGLSYVDLALEKSFKLPERGKATFRFEMFNVLNHANFGLPNTTALTASGAANPSAGVITYTVTSSRQIQLALRINF